MSDINTAPEKITLTAIRAWSAEEVIDLYRAGGWWEMGWDKNQIPTLINGSYLVLIARDSENNAVGMGRLISDGSSDCYIQDVVVFQEYRGMGIGSRIVNTLKRIAELTGHTWIGLISAPGKEKFYKRAGFSIMENYTPMLKEE